MRTPRVDDRVRLLGSVPNTALCRGQVGVVCSQWHGNAIGSEPMYEVEFTSRVEDFGVDVSRRLVPLGQMELAEEEKEPVTA